MQSTPGTRRASSRRLESHLTVAGTVRTPTRSSPRNVNARFSQMIRPATSRLSGSQPLVRARTNWSNAGTIPGANSEPVTTTQNVPTSRRSVIVKAKVTKAKSAGTTTPTICYVDLTTEKPGMKKLSTVKEKPTLPKRTNPVQTNSVAVQTDKSYSMTKGGEWDQNDSQNLNVALTCPVCFHSMFGDSGGVEKRSIVSIGKCGHLFCRNCSLLIYKKNPKCPLCRSEIALKDFRTINFN